MQRVARGFLMLVSVVDGVTGLACGVLFLVSPDGSLMGFEPLLTVVSTLPFADVFFRDLTWIGIAMLAALGIPNAIAALLLLRRHVRQYDATLVAGMLLLFWTGFELIFMYNHASLVYFIVGVISVWCSVHLRRSRLAQ